MPRSAPASQSSLTADRFAKQMREFGAGVVSQKAPWNFSQLQQYGLGSPIIISAREGFRLKRTVSFIRETLFPTGSKNAERMFFGTEFTSANSIDALASAVTNTDLFTPRQLVIIHECQGIRANMYEKLQDAVKKSHDGVLLVLLFTEDEGEHAAKFAGENATLLVLPPLRGELLRRSIEKELERNGLSGAEPEAIRALVDAYGETAATLEKDLQRLALLTPPGGKLSRTLVESEISRSREETSFSLVNSFARGDSVHSFIATRQLVEQNFHPLQLSALFSKCIRVLLTDKTRGKEKIGGELGNPWMLKNISAASREYSLPRLAHALDEVAKLDRRLKSSGFSPELTLELSVQELALKSTPEST